MSTTHTIPPIRLPRGAIEVAGPDAGGFLHGLVTNDVSGLATGTARYAGLLTPQGKVLADMMIWRLEPDRFILDVDERRCGVVTQRLSLYKLRAVLTVRDVSPEWAILAALQDPDAPPPPGGLAARDPRFPNGALGARLLARAASSGGDPACAAYAARLVALGAPDLVQDAAEAEVFALEALFEELHGVDFQKGCFVGQENVSRMKRRATTRRKFCPVVGEDAALTPGAVIRAAGVEIGGMRSVDQRRGLALLRLDRALEAVRCGGDLTADGQRIRLDPPPWLIMPNSGEE